MYGVTDGIYYCGLERTQELSDRMAVRNVPSTPLQPQFSIRPVSTKYALLPILDRRAPTTVPITRQPTYNIGQTFNPGSAQAPWAGFAANVNNESQLRNQFFALQRCEQSNYVPSTNSDMYQVAVSGRQETQPYPGLFAEPHLEPFNPNTCNIGKHLFDNCTRVQLKQV